MSRALLLAVLAAVAPGAGARYAVPAATTVEVNAHGRPLVLAEGGQDASESADTTDAPAELVQADTTDAPAELAQADTTDAPAELVQADTTDAPAELAQADTTDAPAELVQADTTEEPSELAQADTTDAPAELVQADTTDAPAELVQADTTEEPSELVQADTTEDPAGLVQADTTEEPAGGLVQADTTEEPAGLAQADTTEEPSDLVQADTTEEPSELVQADTTEVPATEDLLAVAEHEGRLAPQIGNGPRLAAITSAIVKVQNLMAFAKNISDMAESMSNQDGYLAKDVNDSLTHVGLNMKLFKDGQSMVPNQDRLLLKVKELETETKALAGPIATLGSV